MTAAQPRYDAENGLRELRYAAKRTDPVTVETIRVARTLADHLIRHFDGRDLRLVAETLVTASASVGVIAEPNTMGMLAVNVQAFAGLFVHEAATEAVTP